MIQALANDIITTEQCSVHAENCMFKWKVKN